MSFSETIHAWFDRYWGGALYLPDGWYGRPWDGQCSLTSLSESPGDLRLLLDGVVSLRFVNLRSIKASETGLSFTEFEQLEFRAKATDAPAGPILAAKDYRDGTLSILIPPG